MLKDRILFRYKAAIYSVAVFLIILSPIIFNDSSLAKFFANPVLSLFQEKDGKDLALEHNEELFSLRKKVVVSNMVDNSVVGLDEREKRMLIHTILEEGGKYNVDPLLVLALMEIESTFYHMARSDKNAYGLMQIRRFVGEALAEELDIILDGEESLFDPVTNVRLGIFYLYKLINRFNQLSLALAAYNYGPTHIERVIKNGYNPPIRYSSKVLNVYRDLVEEAKLVDLDMEYQVGNGFFHDIDTQLYFSGINILYKSGFLVGGLNFIKKGSISKG